MEAILISRESSKSMDECERLLGVRRVKGLRSLYLGNLRSQGNFYDAAGDFVILLTHSRKKERL